MHTHILCAFYTGLSCPLLYLWYVIIIPMYNVHPYFPLKNLGKKVCIIHGKIWVMSLSFCRLKIGPWFVMGSKLDN